MARILTERLYRELLALLRDRKAPTGGPYLTRRPTTFPIPGPGLGGAYGNKVQHYWYGVNDVQTALTGTDSGSGNAALLPMAEIKNSGTMFTFNAGTQIIDVNYDHPFFLWYTGHFLRDSGSYTAGDIAQVHIEINDPDGVGWVELDGTKAATEVGSALSASANQQPTTTGIAYCDPGATDRQLEFVGTQTVSGGASYKTEIVSGNAPNGTRLLLWAPEVR